MRRPRSWPEKRNTSQVKPPFSPLKGCCNCHRGVIRFQWGQGWGSSPPQKQNVLQLLVPLEFLEMLLEKTNAFHEDLPRMR